MITFPSIEQYSHAVKSVNERAAFTGRDENGDPIYAEVCNKPTIAFVGAIKLHGSNAAVVQHSDGTLTYQSRHKALTLEDDYHGYVRLMSSFSDHFWSGLFSQIRETWSVKSSIPVAVYGEYCGPSLSSGAAIVKLPQKMFVIFAIRFGAEEETVWVPPEEMVKLRLERIEECPEQVKNVFDYQTYQVTIDFNEPAFSRNTLVELTEAVEKECPFAKQFGISGVGEGIVWRPVKGEFNESRFWFKVKGKEHSATKVKVLAPVNMEKVKSVNLFVDQVLTENRLVQGISYLQEMNIEISRSSTGEFLRWVINDVMKEEKDAMGDLDMKDLNQRISTQARTWFFNNLKNYAIN